MHKLVILIEEMQDPGEFEAGWPQFLHWAEQMPGLRREATSRVTRQLFGDRPYAMIHELYFNTLQEALLAMESQAGQMAGQTLQGITKGRLSLFMADHLEDDIQNLPARGSQESPGPGDPDA